MKNTVLVLLLGLLSHTSFCQEWKTYFDEGMKCSDNLASSQECLDNFNKALILLTKEESTVTPQGSRDYSYIEIKYRIGYTQYYLQKFDSARKTISECISEGNQLFARPNSLMGDIHLMQATIFGSLYLHDSTLHQYKLARDIYKEVNGVESNEYCVAISGMAMKMQQMGLGPQAEQVYLEAYALSKHNENQPALAMNAFGLAAFYGEIGDDDKAEVYGKEAVDVLEPLVGKENQIYATFLSIYGSLLETKNKDSLAEEAYINSAQILKRVMKPDHHTYASALVNLGSFYDDYKKSDSLYSEAEYILRNLQETQPLAYAGILGHRASLWREMNIAHDSTATYLKRALKIRQTLNPLNPNTYRSSTRELAEYYLEHGNYSQAKELFLQTLYPTIDFIKKYFDYLSEAERTKMFQNIDFTINAFQSFSVDNLSSDPALIEILMNLQLSAKSILLSKNQDVSQEILQSDNQDLILLYQEVQTLKQQVGNLKAQGKTEGPILSLEKKLTFKDRTLTAMATEYLDDLDELTWRDIQKKLTPGEAAVEILRTKKYHYNSSSLDDDTSSYVAIIITPETVERPDFVILKNGIDMEQKHIELYQNAIKHQVVDTRSYDIFWNPIANRLQGVKKVFLSSDGVYFQLSPETLYNSSTAQYVIDEVDIVHLSNLKELIKRPTKVKNKNYAMLIGDPLFANNTVASTSRSSMSISSLPNTKIEIEEISELLKEHKWKINAHLGPFAEEEKLKSMDRPRVLHIATHGFYKPEKGKKELALFQSGLLLTGAQPTLQLQANNSDFTSTGANDGILTAHEAMNLNLYGTELVVLSACETGLGNIEYGEGVFGLQRALQIAGAKQILMSLWTVDDSSTKELMTTFYKHWLSGASTREAFHQAQIELRSEYPHPYYWGAFIMLGK